MHIAAFNCFPFHYEMFGYIIYFCKKNNFQLTIFSNTANNLGYFEFYKDNFKDYTYELRDIKLFESLKNNYDVVFLMTDDDPVFQRGNYLVENKTISIVHSSVNRNPSIKNEISVRPKSNYLLNYALPIYEIFNSKHKKNRVPSNNINITILSDCPTNYQIDIINKLKSSENKKIILHAISRSMSHTKFNGLKQSYELKIYRNINMKDLIPIFLLSDYVMTDVNHSKDYVNTLMSGTIPLAFSTLTPLIISKQTNAYYKFENVIEFNNDLNKDIELIQIDLDKLEQERTNILDKNNYLLNSYCKKICKNKSI